MKKFLTLILALVLVMSLMVPTLAVDYGAELNPEDKTYTQHFSDVPTTNWAFTYIEDLVERGAINGFPDGKFYPKQVVTREQFAKIMVVAAGVTATPVKTSSYSDIKPTDWCSPFVEAAKPYMTAYRDWSGKLSFKPKQGALREDMAVAVVKLRGYDTRLADLSLLEVMFSDADTISESAKPYVALAVENKLISGYPGADGQQGTFGPQRTITRAEAAAILWRAFQYGSDQKVSPDDPAPDPVVTPSVNPVPSAPDPVPDSSEPETPNTQQGYEIDTIASNLLSFRSMVMDNDGTVYYINGNTVYNTENSKTLNLGSSFDKSLENPYLAYDSYHDIVYLLAGGTLSVYDISDFDDPTLVLDETNCPALGQVVGGNKLCYESGVTPQITVLKNGALMVPFDLNGTWMVNPSTKAITPTVAIYGSVYSSDMKKVLGNSVISLRTGSKDATVAPLSDSDHGNAITLEVEAPWNNGNSVIVRNDLIYYYDNSLGVCTIAVDGSADVPIPQSSISVNDYQSLTSTNIWSLDANKNGDVAFYDNSLNCIRLISRVQ